MPFSAIRAYERGNLITFVSYFILLLTGCMVGPLHPLGWKVCRAAIVTADRIGYRLTNPLPVEWTPKDSKITNHNGR